MNCKRYLLINEKNTKMTDLFLRDHIMFSLARPQKNRRTGKHQGLGSPAGGVFSSAKMTPSARQRFNKQ